MARERLTSSWRSVPSPSATRLPFPLPGHHGYSQGMQVKLRNPDRVVEVKGPKTVVAMLEELDIVPESVLVIRDKTLLTRDERVADSDEVEVRPVLSGGGGGWR